MPATSPTLSPTLSAIVAGLRGSSSGMPASTLPTRSAPTSAALVKMPPPTRAKSAAQLAPMPNMTIVFAMVSASQRKPYSSIRNQTDTSSMPSPTTVKPMTEPEDMATRRPRLRLSFAALAVRALAVVAMRIPTKPAMQE